MATQYLDLGDLMVIASAVLDIEIEVLTKAANVVMADSALHAPAASFEGIEFYSDLETKIAVLGYRLARNHPFIDGNKRIAFLAMIEFADRNGRSWRPLDEDDTVDTMVGVASGMLTEEQFIEWVARQLEPAAEHD